MVIRERPLGIWIICLSLLCAALVISFLSMGSGRAGLVSAIALGLAGLFVFGLMFRVTWLYFAFLIFLSLSLFLQVVATLLILSVLVASGDIDWLQVVSRYWPGALLLIAVCRIIFYLGRSQVRAYFFPVP